jgi:hypothetical protein
MFKRIIFCTMLLAALPLTAYAAASGCSIRETDTEIIVECYGNEEDLKAARIIRDSNDKQQQIEAERQRVKVEQSNAKIRAKQAARMADVASGKDKGNVEVEKEEGE